jgi:hypothetical protein
VVVAPDQALDTYAAYDRLPLDSDDEWGNLASFLAAAGSA